MKNVLNILNAELTNKRVRKYPNCFYCWAYLKINGEVYDLGDPFPASSFPVYAAVMQYIISKCSEHIQVSERDFRQYFKNVKDGAVKYADSCDILEKRGVEFY